jgi:hypothetical protein
VLLTKWHKVKRFGNRTLRQVAENWIRLLIEELYNNCPSPNMTRVIKSRKPCGEENTTHMAEKKIHTGL